MVDTGDAGPARPDLPTGHHLRPIQVEDLAIDYPTVMGCQPRLRQLFGPVWGWPPADMSIEQDRDDLIRHANEMSRNESAPEQAPFLGIEDGVVGPLEQPRIVGRDISWAAWHAEADDEASES